jgi:hypothetical protein
MPSSARIEKPAWTQSSTVNRLVAAPARSIAIINYPTVIGDPKQRRRTGPFDDGVTINSAYE